MVATVGSAPAPSSRGPGQRGCVNPSVKGCRAGQGGERHPGRSQFWGHSGNKRSSGRLTLRRLALSCAAWGWGPGPQHRAGSREGPQFPPL